MTVAPGPRWSRRPCCSRSPSWRSRWSSSSSSVPGWNGWSGPAVLAVATLGVAAAVGRHCARLDAAAIGVRGGPSRSSRCSWAWATSSARLTGAGVNPGTAGPSDLLLAATGPVAVLLCVRLMRSTGGRDPGAGGAGRRRRPVALGVLLQMLVPLTADPAGGPVDPLLTVFYPAVAAVLCAVGLVTVGAVSAPRRTAAAWLLAGLRLAGGHHRRRRAGRRPPLAAAGRRRHHRATSACSPPRRSRSPPTPAPGAGRRPRPAVPLFGVVVSYCLSSVVLLLLLGCLAAGRPLVAPRRPPSPR